MADTTAVGCHHGLLALSIRSPDEAQCGDHETGAGEHDANHPLHEPELKCGQVGFRRQRVGINAGGIVLGGTAHSFRDGIGVVRCDASRDQLASDFMGVEHVISLARGHRGPRAILETFATLQMVDVHLPTTDGRQLVLPRHTRPNREHVLLLHQLNLQRPAQPAPRLTTSHHVPQRPPHSVV